MRILVVEDEADLNLLLCKVLTRAGYTVDGCMDGEEAELHLMGAEYDGILLDVMLPKKDGYTLVQELRARYPTGCCASWFVTRTGNIRGRPAATLTMPPSSTTAKSGRWRSCTGIATVQRQIDPAWNK